MKICLINPPIPGGAFEGYQWTNNSYTMQHLGIAYIAAVLKKNNYVVEIIECPGSGIDSNQLCEIIKNEKYEMIGISCYFYNYVNVLRIATKIRNELPNSFILLGGYMPTLCYNTILAHNNSVNCCVIGEGEMTSLELVNCLKQKRDWRSVPGIAYKEKNRIVINQQREHIEDLDMLPFPIRKQVSNRFMPILTSRGCYGKCVYCGVREYYDICNIRKMRFRSPVNVADEIEKLNKEYNPKLFLISDETFFSSSKNRNKWLNDFFTVMQLKKINISFQALARANDVLANKEIIIKMKDIGLVNVFIGVESFVQRQLDFYNKKILVKQNLDAVRFLIENGFKLSMGLMILDPFTTIDEIKTNIYWLRETQCYRYVDEKQELFSIDGPVIAIPGTELYYFLEKNNLLTDTYYKYDFQDPDTALFYKITEMHKEYVKTISQKFYLILKAREYEQYEEESILQRAKTEAMFRDLDFMDELCEFIKRGNTNSDNINLFIKKWENEFIDLKRVFSDVDQRLSQFK
jgi:radical SAM superfamily enzyme YgiQ (UPF0313 family)